MLALLPVTFKSPSNTQSHSVKHHIGIFLQFVVLAVLPILVIWQLYFGIPLIVMPVSLTIGVVMFTLGTKLREL